MRLLKREEREGGRRGGEELRLGGLTKSSNVPGSQGSGRGRERERGCKLYKEEK